MFATPDHADDYLLAEVVAFIGMLMAGGAALAVSGNQPVFSHIFLLVAVLFYVILVVTGVLAFVGYTKRLRLEVPDEQ